MISRSTFGRKAGKINWTTALINFTSRRAMTRAVPIASSGDTMTSITQRTHLMLGQLNAIHFSPPTPTPPLLGMCCFPDGKLSPKVSKLGRANNFN